MITPVICSLRQAYPNATIDVLVSRTAPQVLSGNPDVDEVLHVPRQPTLADYWKLFRRLGRRYDLALSNQTNDRVIWYLLAASAHRIARVGNSRKRDGWKPILLSRHYIKDHSESMLLQNLRILDLIDCPKVYEVVPPLEELPPLPELPANSRPFVIIHPTPSSPLKRWTLSGWGALLDWLWQQGYQPILSGGPGEQEQQYVASVAASSSVNSINLCGRLTLGQWSQLLRRSALYVGTDTSMSHLASANATPTVVLFSKSAPNRWGPWPKGYLKKTSPFSPYGPIQKQLNTVVVQGNDDCIPCGAKVCLRNQKKLPECLQHLSAQQVIDAIELLRLPHQIPCASAVST